jgi:hypothetical protein
MLNALGWWKHFGKRNASIQVDEGIEVVGMEGRRSVFHGACAWLRVRIIYKDLG